MSDDIDMQTQHQFQAPGWFLSRAGHQAFKFDDPDKGGRGYLPQLNEWAQSMRKNLKWDCEYAGGAAHMPLWEACPIRASS